MAKGWVDITLVWVAQLVPELALRRPRLRLELFHIFVRGDLVLLFARDVISVHATMSIGTRA